jgi:hypothetical protein
MALGGPIPFIPRRGLRCAAMRARYHVAVRRSDDDAILVLDTGSMPGFTLDDAPWWQVVTPVVDRLRDDLGLDVVALRAVWLGEPAADGSVDRLVEVALRGGRVPIGARWVALEDLERRSTPLGRAIDAGALEPADGQLQPWYRPDWFDRMTTWVDAAVRDAGLRRRGPIRQVRSWGRAALLTLDTDRGRVWAKQVPGVFAHEIAVTRLLGDVDPGFVAPEITADPAGGRVLMEHVEGPLLSDIRDDPAPWSATLARLAEVQRVIAADLDAVRVAGVPSAPISSLAEALPRLLDRPGVAAPIRDAIDDLVAACRALAASPIGPSVEHGDLSPGQVIVGEMGPVILDWSDSTITHPFLAAASFLIEPDDLPSGGDGSDVSGPLADAYLAAWGGGPDARHALDLASVVYPLHLVQLYEDRILPGLEQRWEMEQMIPWGLQRLERRLPELPRILGR